MNQLGDRTKGATLYFPFNTAIADGTPTGMTDTPTFRVRCLDDSSTITAGVTASLNVDGITGLNLVTVDTSNAAYVVGKSYQVEISEGTVGTVPQDGRIIGTFALVAEADTSDLATAVQSVLARLAEETTIQQLSSVSATGTITLHRGIDYTAPYGKPPTLALAAATWGDLSSATIELVTELERITGTVSGTGADQVVTFTVTHTETEAMAEGQRDYHLLITYSGDTRVAAGSGLLIVKDLPAPATE